MRQEWRTLCSDGLAAVQERHDRSRREPSPQDLTQCQQCMRHFSRDAASGNTSYQYTSREVLHNVWSVTAGLEARKDWLSTDAVPLHYLKVRRSAAGRAGKLAVMSLRNFSAKVCKKVQEAR